MACAFVYVCAGMHAFMMRMDSWLQRRPPPCQMNVWSSTCDYRRSLDRSRGRSLDHRSLGRSIARSLERSVVRSLGRSVAWSLGRSVARSFGSIARSLDRSIVRSIGRSLDRPMARSLDRCLDRCLDRSIARSFDRSLDRSIARSIARSLDRSTVGSVLSVFFFLVRKVGPGPGDLFPSGTVRVAFLFRSRLVWVAFSSGPGLKIRLGFEIPGFNYPVGFLARPCFK